MNYLKIFAMKATDKNLTNREKYDLSVLCTIFFLICVIICMAQFDADGAIILIVFALISALSSMHFFLKLETEKNNDNE